MAKSNTCYLCGQKLSRGVCTCCGLDNARMTRRNYRLNETTPYHIKRQQVAAQKAESMQYAQAYKNRQAKLEDLGTPIKSSAKNKDKKPKWKGIKIVGVLSILVSLLPSIGSCLGDIFDAFGTGTYEYEAEPYDITEEYAYVEKELSENGEYVSYEMLPGCYIVGTHIPEGNYTITFVDGSYGNAVIDDEENDIYMSHFFGENADEISSFTELSDVRLYEGAYVEISGDGLLLFESDNAQVDKIKGMDNPIDTTESVTLPISEEVYVVGEDIQEGFYDLFVEEGYANVVIKCEDPSGYSCSRYYWIMFDTYENDYQNILLKDGMTILVEYGEVQFEPSDWIGIEDYDTYMKRYIYY